MKKSLLFAAALLASAAVSAQTVTWPCSVDRATKEVNLSATVNGSETLKAENIVMGADIQINQKDDAPAPQAVKNVAGENTMFPTEEYGMIGWQPINGNVDGSEATAELAEGAGCYVDFSVEETDVTKDLTGLNSITFDVSKVGTDAIRINARLLGEGDGDINSEWLINETNAYTFGDTYNLTDGSKGDPWDENANGYNPSRNDGSKGSENGANPDGYSSVTLTMPADVKALNPYKLTFRVVIINTANNKALALNAVTFNFGENTGIQEITNSEAKANGAAFNIAGQRVAADAKGIVIVNGKKYINK